MRSGSPSSSPTRRTSSLNSWRNGSTSSMRMSAGKPADVVVRLDLRRHPDLAARLDHVRVERPLHEEADVSRAIRASSSKTRMNSSPTIFRFVSGSSDPGEPREKPLLRLHVHERHLEVAAEGLDHLLGLVLAQQPVVDEHAGELVADRLVHEQRRHRRVDAAREPADDPLASRPARGCAPPAPRSPPRASRPAAAPTTS